VQFLYLPVLLIQLLLAAAVQWVLMDQILLLQPLQQQLVAVLAVFIRLVEPLLELVVGLAVVAAMLGLHLPLVDQEQ
jgi:hypothetical protein